MAAIQEVMKIISTRISAIPDYDGQEPPDTYYNKLRNVNESCRPLGCNAFDVAQRTNIIKGKMAGRYREIMVGSTRAALKALMSEKFSMLDTPDTYEKELNHIRKFFMLEVIVIISFSKVIEGYWTNNLRKYYVYYDKVKVIEGYRYQ
ncbi:hypothetical protein Glove_294g4 [Diversispora epigaea]|uniref:Uncharacterized protein n=1 Tax=Diversispora epigaea TaxID=1348612 RepID=A0A397I0C8_9GLOM|nr:hypothetical protein Glove_294g4 [Diversispora epigaea]